MSGNGKPVIQPTCEADFTFARDEPFRLESGGTLQPVTVRYAVYGRLNAERDNAILVCHALSGSARVADWWDEIIGEGRLLDTSRYCIIGVNILGSWYGSTGPGSIDPCSGEPYGPDFPLVTIGDMVRAQARLLDHLGIARLRAVIGGSIGGMQALQWATDFPVRVDACIAIGATPLSAMGLALNHLQRQAIELDPDFRDGHYTRQPAAGLSLARAIAMCTYKSAALFDQRYHRKPNRNGEDPRRSLPERFDVAGYLDYQGTSFVERFDANSYLVISKAMDTFELRDDNLRRICARVLLVGISSDWLFPTADVRELRDRLRRCGVHSDYIEQISAHGHDAFLADAAQLAQLISATGILQTEAHLPQCAQPAASTIAAAD